MRTIDTQALELTLKQAATQFWIKQGAKFGERQTTADLNPELFPEEFYIPTRLRGASFITDEARILVGGYSGRAIVTSLRVIPILKSGKPGQQVELSSITLYNL
jgi:hypothetical protein